MAGAPARAWKRRPWHSVAALVAGLMLCAGAHAHGHAHGHAHTPAPESAENHGPLAVAVLVGVDAYEPGSGLPPVPGSSAEVARLDEELRARGILTRIVIGADAGLESLETVVSRALDEVGTEIELVVFYFRGRGVVDGGDLCFAPADGSATPSDRLVVVEPFLEWLTENPELRVLAALELEGVGIAELEHGRLPARLEIVGSADDLLGRVDELAPDLEAARAARMKPREGESGATGPQFVAPSLLGPAKTLAPPEGRPECSGRVRVFLTVDEVGYPADVEVVGLEFADGCPEDELRALALAEVRGWRFRPARLNGFPVPKRIGKTVTFAGH